MAITLGMSVLDTPPKLAWAGFFGPQRAEISVSVLAAEEQNVAALFAACAVAAGNVVVATALSAVDGAVRPAVFELGQRFVSRAAGGLFPVAAEVFGAVSLAARTSFLVASDICCPGGSFRYWGEQAVQ